MDVEGKVVVVTGAASGIGRGLALRFAREGARAVVAVDYDAEGATAVAGEIASRHPPRPRARGGPCSRWPCGPTSAVEADLVAAIDRCEADLGPIDLFCSNAGILVIGGQELPDDEWRRIIDVNLMGHVYAARHLVPRMLDRGGGYLLNTCSAAGLLTQIGSAPYSVTKHAALSFAEWLAITYGDRGLKVSALCPQAVESKMTMGIDGGGVAGVDGMLTPDQVAEAVVEGLADERFLILPHPEVHRVLPPQGVRLRPLAGGHAPPPGPLRDRDVSGRRPARRARPVRRRPGPLPPARPAAVEGGDGGPPRARRQRRAARPEGSGAGHRGRHDRGPRGRAAGRGDVDPAARMGRPHRAAPAALSGSGC